MRKSGCAAQKRGFACAVIYLEYTHIYRHLLLSEIDYKPRLFSQFQIKKVHRKIPSYGQLFYIECPTAKAYGVSL